VLAAVRVPELFDGPLRLPVYALGLALVLATLPAFVAALTSALGERLARTGATLGRPGMLVSGRRVAAHPRVASRSVAALVVMIGLASQAQLWTGLLGDNAIEAAEAGSVASTFPTDAAAVQNLVSGAATVLSAGPPSASGS
jgi:hypothetical protein